MKDLNWNDLKVVLAVFRERSFQGAGRALRVSHTTVSRRVAALEHRVGIELFIHQGRHCFPTPACVRLVAAAERTEDELLKTQLDPAFPARHDLFPFRIISVPWVIHEILLPEVGQLLALMPDLRLQLDGSLSDETPDSLGKSLALRFELAPNRAETAIPVAKIGYAVFASADHHDPESLPWVSFHGSAPMEWMIRQGVDDRDIVLTLTDGAAVAKAIGVGIGRGLIPECLAASVGNLRRLSGPEPEFRRLLRAVGPWSDLMTPEGQSVVKWVELTFGRQGCRLDQNGD